ncbi:MAG: hypothetical protein D6807_09655, partial [Alphaproteobacteria bacterium]
IERAYKKITEEQDVWLFGGVPIYKESPVWYMSFSDGVKGSAASEFEDAAHNMYNNSDRDWAWGFLDDVASLPNDKIDEFIAEKIGDEEKLKESDRLAYVASYIRAFKRAHSVGLIKKGKAPSLVVQARPVMHDNEMTIKIPAGTTIAGLKVGPRVAQRALLNAGIERKIPEINVDDIIKTLNKGSIALLSNGWTIMYRPTSSEYLLLGPSTSDEESLGKIKITRVKGSASLFSFKEGRRARKAIRGLSDLGYKVVDFIHPDGDGYGIISAKHTPPVAGEGVGQQAKQTGKSDGGRPGSIASSTKSIIDPVNRQVGLSEYAKAVSRFEYPENTEDNESDRIKPAIIIPTEEEKKTLGSAGDVRDQISEIIGKKVYRRSQTGKMVIGTYWPDTTKTTVLYRDDIDTMFHETGHFVDDTFGLSKDLYTEVETQVGEITVSNFVFTSKGEQLKTEMSQLWVHGSAKENSTSDVKAKEAMAEWLRAYALNPDETRSRFPALSAHVLQKMPVDFQDKWVRAGILARKWYGLTPIDKINNSIIYEMDRRNNLYNLMSVPSREARELARKTQKYKSGIIDKFISQFVDDLHPFVKAVRIIKESRGLRAIAPSQDPEILVRLFAGVDSAVRAQFESGPTAWELWDSGVLTTAIDSYGMTMGGIEWILQAFETIEEDELRLGIKNQIAFMVAQRVIWYNHNTKRLGLNSLIKVLRDTYLDVYNEAEDARGSLIALEEQAKKEKEASEKLQKDAEKSNARNAVRGFVEVRRIKLKKIEDEINELRAYIRITSGLARRLQEFLEYVTAHKEEQDRKVFGEYEEKVEKRRQEIREYIAEIAEINAKLKGLDAQYRRKIAMATKGLSRSSSEYKEKVRELTEEKSKVAESMREKKKRLQDDIR